MTKRFTGYNSETLKNRATGAGAYFTNFNPTTDTFASAITKGKLIGATKGGGTFTAIPTIREIEIDGVPGRVRGMREIDFWDVSLLANVIEVTPNTLKLLLTAGTVTDTTTPNNYKLVLGKNILEEEDYLENVTFIGSMTGYDSPIILQVFNAISITGMSYVAADKTDTVIPMTFQGHYNFDTLDNPPFAIWIPCGGES